MDASIFDYTLSRSQLPGPAYQKLYRGKVRDVYELRNNVLAIIATDRVSAFDHILAETIPFKGQILNQLAAHAMEQVRDIVDTHIIDLPHPNLMLARKCEPLPVEVVVRGYLAGHALREYKAGRRELCGVSMPEGLLPYEEFKQPLLTPTTKATKGHDEDISEEAIISQGLVSATLWEKVRETALKLFQRGSETARARGLLLVDTKYEFGLRDGRLVLIDETHTPDSSRYIYKKGYEERLEKGEAPQQLSKEFVREWLMEQGFSGKNGEQMPKLPDSFRQQTYERYAELFKQLTGRSFTPVYTPNYSATFSELLKPYI
ncbi:MAG: phosphoribosylaminoimidazolesuccinocarboxamide synthase [Cyclonatronaceae bacterium]